MLKVVLISLIVSFDAFVLAASYATRKISISRKSAGIMAGISAVFGGVSISLQNVLILFVPIHVLQWIGGAILFGLGIKTLWEAKYGNGGEKFDRDCSKSIEKGEALVLGGVLATDVVCVGISLPMTGGVEWGYPVLVGVFMYAGLSFCPTILLRCPAVEYLSGIFLILVGIFGGIGL